VLKKLAAISLIALLIFNWYGYRLLISYFEKEATTHLQAKLDKEQYDESTLIQVRVPLNTPYIADWNHFEKYEGETEINGVHYKYVKRKIEKGELVLLCIPNQQKTSLQAAKQNFFQQVNDLQQPGAKKDAKDHAVKISFSDYIDNSTVHTKLLQGNAPSAYSYHASFIAPVYLSIPAQPPEC
jgi:hypothetical protein